MFGLYRKISNLHFAVLISLSLGSPRQGLGLRPCGGRDGGERSPLTMVWPGFDSRTRRHIWVEFVVGSLLCSKRFFSGYSSFSLSLKTNISKFQFDRGMDGHFKRVLVNSWCSVGKQITFTFLLHLHFFKRYSRN